MRKYSIFILFLFIAFTSSCESDDDCKYNEICENSECIEFCDEMSCGRNTTCEIIDKKVNCKCKKGHSGNPKIECFKLNEESPCDPNNCGKHSTCIEADDELGPHCKCLPNFHGFPPNCGIKCDSENDCAASEICDFLTEVCFDMCDNCGENSNCRVDKEARKVFCSCKESFIPERDVGCREKLSSDIEIPLDLIALKTADVKCGLNAYSDDSGFCKCMQGYEGDAKISCDLIEFFDEPDDCHPNQCGSYSQCEIIQGNASCSCIDGFGEYPTCTSCRSSSQCENDKLCVSGKCIENVCANYCGFYSDCNVIDGYLTCHCKISKSSKPFSMCEPKKVRKLKMKTLKTLAYG